MRPQGLLSPQLTGELNLLPSKMQSITRPVKRDRREREKTMRNPSARTWLAFTATTVLATLLGVAAASADGLKAEVLHWWTSGGESAAVKVFASQFDAAGGQWVDAAVAGGGGEAARAAGINRIVGGNPPTAMQFNTSKQFDELISQGLLSNLDAVAAKDNWKAVVNPVVMNAVTREGHVYAVPVNIHSNNWLWYSPAALAKAGAAPPKTWDEFFAAADKLKAAGIIPLAQAGDSWTQLLTYHDVLLGVGGKDLFMKIYKDLDVNAVKSPEFKKVAEIFGKLRFYGDEGQQGRQWNQAIALVITGKAGFNFMGDWAKGEILAAGQTPGKEVGCIPGLGQQIYWIGGDVFVFPKSKNTQTQAAQQLLAHVMLSPDTQVAFNNKKGSVPVRTDVDTSKMDSCAQAGLALLKSGSYVPGSDLLITPDLNGSLQDAVGSFWTDKSKTPDDFVKAIADVIASAK
jgi:glucose/mannose transport system substrate-binding protein